MFYGTACTEFDVMYFMYIYYCLLHDGYTELTYIHYYLSHTFYGLVRKTGQYYPFEDNTLDVYGLPRFIFYKYNI